MKKLYTLIVAAGVSALACSAAVPQMAEANSASLPFAKSMKVTNTKAVVSNEGMRKAPAAKAGANCPETLEGLNVVMYTSVPVSQTQYMYFPETLTFSYVRSDNEGYQLYNMSGWLNEMFTNFEVLPIPAIYDPSTGQLVLDTTGVVAKATEKDGSKTDLYLYTTAPSSQEGYYSYFLEPMPIEFEYADGYFDWVNEVSGVDEETGKPYSYTFDGYAFGTKIVDNEKGADMYVRVKEPYMRVAQGTMTYEASGENSAGQPFVEQESNPIYVEMDGDDVMLDGFAEVVYGGSILFNLDKDAKTLTASEYQVGYTTDTHKPIYFGTEVEKEGAGGYLGTYTVVCPYTTTDKTTEITVPNWNFFYEDADDPEPMPFAPYLFHKTKIVLNFNIDGSSSVGNIAVDEADANAPVEFFNLQGIRVNKPENGLFIRRQGKTVSKVLVK